MTDFLSFFLAYSFLLLFCFPSRRGETGLERSCYFVSVIVCLFHLSGRYPTYLSLSLSVHFLSVLILLVIVSWLLFISSFVVWTLALISRVENGNWNNEFVKTYPKVLQFAFLYHGFNDEWYGHIASNNVGFEKKKPCEYQLIMAKAPPALLAWASYVLMFSSAFILLGGISASQKYCGRSGANSVAVSGVSGYFGALDWAGLSCCDVCFPAGHVIGVIFRFSPFMLFQCDE